MSDSQISPSGQPVSMRLEGAPPPARRILVVDDDLSVRRLDTAVLVNSGYQVDVAEDGAAAWEALNTNRYDLLLTDHAMPKVTGVELLKKLHDARIAVPVIMATGSFPHAEFAELPWLKPAATLIKPYSMERLLGAVKEILRGHADATEDSPNQSPCAQ
jgi:DNA-binding response OmpR family regulator